MIHVYHLKYVFRRSIFQPCDWALPLAGRGGYVTKDKINPTIMLVMSYQIDSKMVTFDTGMLYRITKILFHPHPQSIIVGYDSIQYKMPTSHRWPFQIRKKKPSYLFLWPCMMYRPIKVPTLPWLEAFFSNFLTEKKSISLTSLMGWEPWQVCYLIHIGKQDTANLFFKPQDDKWP